eukprot:2578034-Pleurochrysis_carterae.AAC.1
MATSTRLKVGDVVSAAVGVFGEEYARSRGARPWRSEEVRDTGKIVGKKGNVWLVDFEDGNGSVELARKALHFVSRAGQAEGDGEAAVSGETRITAVEHADGDSSDGGEQVPEAPAADSSDD